MGSCCCKSQKPVTNDTTNTALLTEPVTDITETDTVSLQVNNKTDEVQEAHSSDVHTLTEFMPNIRELQLLIFQTINDNRDYYDIYPEYSTFSSIWNASFIQKEQQNIYNMLLDISLTIALHANGANVAYIDSIYSVLDSSIRIHHQIVLLPELLQLITTFIPCVTFSTDIHSKNKRRQLEFSYNDNVVTFKYMANDYLNIRSAYPLVGDKILIHCYVASKGDEMWIGVVNKKTYGISKEIEKKFGSLLYYGGREKSIDKRVKYTQWDNGWGAIHGFGAVLKTVDVYRSCDWISFLIETNKLEPSCTIFKNGAKIFHIDALPFKEKQAAITSLSTIYEEDEDEDELYFCVVVDDAMDSFVIEEALC